MLKTIFSYELKYQFRLISTHIYFGVILLFSYLATLGAGGTFTGVQVMFTDASSKVFVNSPYYLHSMITAFGYIGIIFVAAIAARTINRDYENETYQWFYTLPLKKSSFVFGRFLASALIIVYIMSGSLIGSYLGAVMPFVDADKFGPNMFIYYIYPFLTSILPYVIFSLSLLLAVSMYFRSTLTLMITGIILLMAYGFLSEVKIDLDHQYILALFDPFGMFMLQHVTKYWTIAEQNTRLIPFSGIFLLNRLIILSAGSLFFAFAYRKFDFKLLKGQSAKKVDEPELQSIKLNIPKPVISTGFTAELKKFFSLTYSNYKYIIKSGPFIGLYIFWLIQTIANSKWIGEMYETTVFPVTALVSRRLLSNSVVFILAMVTIYSGEVIWRERDKKYEGFINSYPVSTLTIFLAKLSSLFMMIYMFLASNIIFGVIVQTLKGYYNFEMAVYFKFFFIYAPVFLIFLTILSFVIHIIANHKYIGYMIVIGYYLSKIFSSAFDVSHPLYSYGNVDFNYSDINAFGYTGRFFALSLYYFIFAAILLLIAKLFWVRSNETGFKQRLKIFRAGFNRGAKLVFGILTLSFVSVGSYIFYNTNILDDYRTNADDEMASVNYEKDFKQYERTPKPSVVDVITTVEIYPEERSLKCSGTYVLKNMTSDPVTQIHVLSDKIVPHRYSFSVPVSLKDSCDYISYNIYNLADPMFPGDSIIMSFEMNHLVKGFKGGGAVYNGTFINNFEYFPMIGYSADMEISDEYKRKKHGLPSKERMASIDDEFARNQNYVGSASWTNFEAVVGTSADQIAVAPGKLVEKWTENGRNYFRYRTPGKILNFFSFNSARYSVKRDRWNDVDLEVYYHEGHEFNIDHMLEMMKLSLETFSKSFGPFQFPVLRIIEFPRGAFAQSFATTIPFSENLGFIIDYKTKNDKGVDYLADITAHEIGHQWWAHQVISANTKGATMLTEVFAQYSSYLVLKQICTPAEIRTYFKYSLDNYLKGRKSERKKELPLTLNENQGYLHYHKGIMAMVALEDYIGSDSLNSALTKFVADEKFTEAPFPVSTDILPYFEAVTPDSLKYLITDLLTKIIVYDNKAVSAETSKTDDGKYLTRLIVTAEKFEADSLGAESKIPMSDYFNIGLLDKDDEPIYMNKYLIDTDSATFEVVTDEMPDKAGIDPSVILIDRKRDDNVIDVKEM